MACARHSPYYRELYQNLPERIDDPTLVPITNQKALMARFDDWVTNRAVTIEKTRPFVENPDLFGKQFLGKYLVNDLWHHQEPRHLSDR